MHYVFQKRGLQAPAAFLPTTAAAIQVQKGLEMRSGRAGKVRKGPEIRFREDPKEQEIKEKSCRNSVYSETRTGGSLK